jgi:hypothetical protein
MHGAFAGHRHLIAGFTRRCFLAGRLCCPVVWASDRLPRVIQRFHRNVHITVLTH